MDNIIKINCTTITTYRNTETGETSTEKLEGPNVVSDVTVQVSPKGLDLMQKVMNKQNENTKPKS